MTDRMELIRQRHSVRRYDGRPIPPDLLQALRAEIDACNQEGNLHIQLVTDEPKAFSGLMAHYGNFTGVSTYLAMVGPKGGDLEERVGWYGERLVLKAQELGLNSCWVGGTYSKVSGAFDVEYNEKLVLVISLGYGITPGHERKSKPMSKLCRCAGAMPGWFEQGMQAAMLAPTAINQQAFLITLNPDGTVSATARFGPYSKTDLGIVKYHFELGAGKENFRWAK